MQLAANNCFMFESKLFYLVGIVTYTESEKVTKDSYLCRVYDLTKRRTMFLTVRETAHYLLDILTPFEKLSTYNNYKSFGACRWYGLTPSAVVAKMAQFMQTIENSGLLNIIPVYNSALVCIKNNKLIVPQVYINAQEILDCYAEKSVDPIDYELALNKFKLECERVPKDNCNSSSVKEFLTKAIVSVGENTNQFNDTVNNQSANFKYNIGSIFTYAVVVSTDASSSEVGFVDRENYSAFLKSNENNIIAPLFDKEIALESFLETNFQSNDKLEIFKANIEENTSIADSLTCLVEVHAYNFMHYNTSKIKASEIPDPPFAFFEMLDKLFSRLKILNSNNSTRLELDSVILASLEKLNLSNLERLSCYVYLARLNSELFYFLLSSKAPSKCSSYTDFAKYSFKAKVISQDMLKQRGEGLKSIMKDDLKQKYTSFMLCCTSPLVYDSVEFKSSDSADVKLPNICALWGNICAESKLLQNVIELGAGVRIVALRNIRYRGYFNTSFDNCGARTQYYFPYYPEILETRREQKVKRDMADLNFDCIWASPYFVLHEGLADIEKVYNLHILASSSYPHLDLVYIGSPVKHTGAFSLCTTFKNLVWLSSSAVSTSALILAWQFKAKIYCSVNSNMANLILSLKHFGYSVNVLNEDLTTINNTIDKAKEFCHCPMKTLIGVGAENIDFDLRSVNEIPENIEINVQFVRTSDGVDLEYKEDFNESKELMVKNLTFSCINLVYFKTYKFCDDSFSVVLERKDGLPIYKVCERLVYEFLKYRTEFNGMYSIFEQEYLRILAEIKEKCPEDYANMLVVNNRIYGSLEHVEFFASLIRNISALLTLSDSTVNSPILYFQVARFWLSYLKPARFKTLADLYSNLKGFLLKNGALSDSELMTNLNYHIDTFTTFAKVVPVEFTPKNLKDFKDIFKTKLADPRAVKLPKIFLMATRDDELWQCESLDESEED